MNRMHSIWRTVKVLGLAAAVWVAVHGHALAGPGPKVPQAPTSGESSHSWVFPYFLVIMGIGVGMIMVCRSSRRSERAKPKQYEGVGAAE